MRAALTSTVTSSCLQTYLQSSRTFQADTQSGRCLLPAFAVTCKCHSVSAPTGYPRHRLLDALHQLRHPVSGQLVGAQAQFATVTLTERVESAIA